jgi:hypothetical protein
MKVDKKRKGIVDTSKAQSEKVRFGAPCGPRITESENYDGRTPIKWPGHEAVAQYLAAPKSRREFKSDSDLAKHFQVDRMTIHRWKNAPDVIKRAHWLSMQNKMVGDTIARREYVSIIEKAVELAKNGNIPAMKFCAERAFPEDYRTEKSRISSSSIAEVLERSREEHIKNGEIMTPTWLKERAKRLGYPPVPPVKVQTEPEAEPKAVNLNTGDENGELP